MKEELTGKLTIDLEYDKPEGNGLKNIDGLFEENEVGEIVSSRDRDIYFINYWDCDFYDEKAERKCLAYDYMDCNNTRAHRCKYAKMQAMEKNKGIASKINFRWRGDEGIMEFKEGYTDYAVVKFRGLLKYEFEFLFKLFQEKSILCDEYKQPLNQVCDINYINEDL